jgi:glycosyltransferase involved in cell wall biosynthesis
LSTVERIRVLHVIARMNVGGPAQNAAMMARGMHGPRFACTIAFGAEDQTEGNYLALHGQSLPATEFIPELGREIKAGQDLKALRSLVALMRRLRPHVVHTHTAKAGTLGRLAASWCKVPVVVHTYHGHVLHSYFSPAKTRFFVEIERWLARRTTRLLTVAEQVRDDLIAHHVGRPEQYVVVPLGLDLDQFQHADRLRGELRRELGLPADAPLVGIVARLVAVKAHEVFLAAAVKVNQAIPSCRFLLVGDGDRRAELEAEARRLGLGDRVLFLGWRADLDRLYADLDVVALTSKNEGSPVALIEAMGAGRPVVSTCVGGVPDVVTDGVTGLLVPHGDAEGLAASIVRLLREPETAARLSQRAREIIEARYAAPILLRNMDQLYSSLLAERGVLVP